MYLYTKADIFHQRTAQTSACTTSCNARQPLVDSPHSCQQCAAISRPGPAGCRAAKETYPPPSFFSLLLFTQNGKAAIDCVSSAPANSTFFEVLKKINQSFQQCWLLWMLKMTGVDLAKMKQALEVVRVKVKHQGTQIL